MPPASASGEAYRYYPITVAGPLFVVQYPVSFKAIDNGPGFAAVCGSRQFIRRARVAAARAEDEVTGH